MPIPVPEADALLANLADATDSKISVGAVLRELFRVFKGPKGFAEEIKLDFDTCPIGHANRIRIESDIMRTLSNYDGEVDDLPDDAETLEAMVREQLSSHE